MKSKPDFIFDICYRIDRMIGSQIRDHCHGWSSWEHQIDGRHGVKVNNVGSFNFSERYNFRPLREIISYSKNGQWPLLDGGLIGPRTSILQVSNSHEATVGWSNSRVGVWNPHGFDKPYTVSHIALCRQSLSANNYWVCVVGPWASNRLMGIVYALMSFFDYFLCFHVGQTMEKYTILWTIVEYLYHWIIVKISRSSLNRSCLLGIIGSYVV